MAEDRFSGTLGNYIRHKMEECDYKTSVQLARRIRISSSALSSIINGYYFPRRHIVLKLARAFGVSPDEIERLQPRVGQRPNSLTLLQKYETIIDILTRIEARYNGVERNEQSLDSRRLTVIEALAATGGLDDLVQRLDIKPVVDIAAYLKDHTDIPELYLAVYSWKPKDGQNYFVCFDLMDREPEMESIEILQGWRMMSPYLAPVVFGNNPWIFVGGHWRVTSKEPEEQLTGYVNGVKSIIEQRFPDIPPREWRRETDAMQCDLVLTYKVK